MKNRSIFIFFSILTSIGLTWAATRGSGSYVTLGNGDRIYLPTAQENPGWLTDLSTNSINLDLIAISSAIYNLQLLAGNTNYIQNRNTLQTSSVFFVSSGTVYGGVFFASSSTIWGTITSTSGFVGRFIGNGGELINLPNASTSYIQNTPTLQASSILYVTSGTIDGQALLARSSGRVGIGTSIPAVPLHVVNADPALRLQRTGDNNNWDIELISLGRLSFTDRVSGASVVLISSGAGGGTFYISSNSRVGIGTGNPITPLHILHATDANIRLDRTNDPNVWDIETVSAGRLSFTDRVTNINVVTIATGAAVNSLVVSSNGFVGVGVGVPSSKFNVENGSITVNGTNSGVTIKNSNGNFVDFTHNGTDAVVFASASGGLVIPTYLKTGGQAILLRTSAGSDEQVSFQNTSSNNIYQFQFEQLPYFDLNPTATASNQAASVEAQGYLFRAPQATWANGNIGRERWFDIEAPTFAFASVPSTIDNAATLYIASAPLAGTNATITNNYALWVDSGAARFDGPVISTGDQVAVQNCGTSPSIIGGLFAGKITVGSVAASNCNVTFTSPYMVNPPACVVTGDNSAVGYSATTSVSSFTVFGSADIASDVISYICVGTY